MPKEDPMVIESKGSHTFCHPQISLFHLYVVLDFFLNKSMNRYNVFDSFVQLVSQKGSQTLKYYWDFWRRYGKLKISPGKQSWQSLQRLRNWWADCFLGNTLDKEDGRLPTYASVGCSLQGNTRTVIFGKFELLEMTRLAILLTDMVKTFKGH